MKQEVESLVTKGAIKEPPEGSYFSNLFLVPKKDGSQRQLNAFVEVPHFKMEEIHTLKPRRLVGESRPEGCLLLYSNQPTLQEIPVFYCRQQDLPIPFALASGSLPGRMQLSVRAGDKDDNLNRRYSPGHGESTGQSGLGYTINKEKTILEPSQILDFRGSQSTQ